MWILGILVLRRGKLLFAVVDDIAPLGIDAVVVVSQHPDGCGRRERWRGDATAPDASGREWGLSIKEAGQSDATRLGNLATLHLFLRHAPLSRPRGNPPCVQRGPRGHGHVSSVLLQRGMGLSGGPTATGSDFVLFCAATKSLGCGWPRRWTRVLNREGGASSTPP